MIISMDVSGVRSKGSVRMFLVLVAFSSIAEVEHTRRFLLSGLRVSRIHIRELSKSERETVLKRVGKLVDKHIKLVLIVDFPKKAKPGEKARKRTWMKKLIIKRIYELGGPSKIGLIVVPSDIDAGGFVLAEELSKEFPDIAVLKSDKHPAIEVADALAYAVRRIVESGGPITFLAYYHSC